MNSNFNNYTINDVIPCTTYYVRMRAINGVGEGILSDEWSNTSNTVRIFILLLAPYSPGSPSITWDDINEIFTFTWTEPDFVCNGIDNYIININNEVGQYNTIENRLSINITDVSLERDHLNFCVKANNTNGNSIESCSANFVYNIPEIPQSSCTSSSYSSEIRFQNIVNRLNEFPVRKYIYLN